MEQKIFCILTVFYIYVKSATLLFILIFKNIFPSIQKPMLKFRIPLIITILLINANTNKLPFKAKSVQYLYSA